MTSITVPNLTPAPTGINACVLGDTLTLEPTDLRFSYTYAVVSAPADSSASFSGSSFEPDLVGEYSLSVEAGSDTATFVVYCFSAANHTALETVSNQLSTTRSDAQARQILRGIANAATTAQLNTWSGGGAFPPGINLQQWGG